jgi:hypothetical protein
MNLLGRITTRAKSLSPDSESTTSRVTSTAGGVLKRGVQKAPLTFIFERSMGFAIFWSTATAVPLRSLRSGFPSVRGVSRSSTGVQNRYVARADHHRRPCARTLSHRHRAQSRPAAKSYPVSAPAVPAALIYSGRFIFLSIAAKRASPRREAKSVSFLMSHRLLSRRW